MTTSSPTAQSVRIVNGRTYKVTRIATAAPRTQEVRPFDGDLRRHVHAHWRHNVVADENYGFEVGRRS